MSGVLGAVSGLEGGAVQRPLRLELVSSNPARADDVITIDDQAYAIEARAYPDSLALAKTWIGRDILVEAVDETGNPMHAQPFSAIACQRRWGKIEPDLARTEVGLQKTVGNQAMFAPAVGKLVWASPHMRKFLAGDDSTFFTGFYRNPEKTPTHRLSLVSPIEK